MKRFFAFLGVLGALSLGATAHADTITYTFTTSGGDSGTLVMTGTVDAVHTDAIDVLSVSGTIDGNAITGLVPGASNGSPQFDATSGYTVDNLAYFYNGAFDQYGLYVSAGGFYYNFYDGSTSSNFYRHVANEQALVAFDPSGPYGNESTQVSVSYVKPTPAVPEPSSLILGGTGILAVIGAARRRVRL